MPVSLDPIKHLAVDRVPLGPRPGQVSSHAQLDLLVAVIATNGQHDRPLRWSRRRNAHRARELIHGIRGYAILEGVRGQKGVDEEALVEVIQRISQMACDHREIAEMEYNPLLAFSDGVVAVDMRVRVE